MNKNGKILGFTMIDIGELPLCLPSPNEGNTGGYTNCISGEFIYSPIDIAVAGLEQLIINSTLNYSKEITDLNSWFIKHKGNKFSELYIYILIFVETLFTNNILELKSLMFMLPNLKHLLLRCAPFTFRGLP